MSDQNQNRKADEEYSDTEGSDSGESSQSEEHRSRSSGRNSGGGQKIKGKEKKPWGEVREQFKEQKQVWGEIQEQKMDPIGFSPSHPAILGIHSIILTCHWLWKI